MSDSTPIFGNYEALLANEELQFRPIDRALGELMARMAPDAAPEIPLAAALLSRERGHGHVCLDLGESFQPELRTPEGKTHALPAREAWLRALRECPALVGQPDEFKPLIFAGDRLYLHRLHTFETQLADALLQRAAQVDSLDEFRFKSACAKFFPDSKPGTDGIDRQHLAARTALSRRLTLITGGPGTGKTHTAGRIITLGLELGALQTGRIALAAPTGKAAARLQEQIKDAFEQSPLTKAPPADDRPQAMTLHRLLGASADGARFWHHADKLLPYDFLLVDEASMIDLLMMSRLFTACGPDTRVVLLGDPDQLTSVDAGSVLADLSGGKNDTGPLNDCRVHLNVSRRAGEGTGILELAERVNTGQPQAALDWIQDPANPHLRHEPLPAADALAGSLAGPVRELFKKVQNAPGAREALAALNEFKILTAMRRGPFGTPAINRQLEQVLHVSGHWYPGRPVLITRNDYAVRLFNGDLGVAWTASDGNGLAVYFISPEGELREIALGRLPEHETAFALTIHKSQGSEFNRVLVLLLTQAAPVLTRELVYTGLTRAKNEVTLMASPETLAGAIEAKTTRTSGLRDALWSGYDFPLPCGGGGGLVGEGL